MKEGIHIFEVIMLICFGAAWPLSIYRSWKSRTTKGKSVFFLIVIVIGYASGVLDKIINNNVNKTVFLYLLNATMVSVDIFLWFRNRSIEKNEG
ncbi:MAG: hypothetical protein LBQ96_06370 [Fusobacteriaceae bacterium]|nr:hypothetical protein [Fusobacteriaceae bacterium]